MSFSSAGWFCRFGRLDERRPVSVLMLMDVWMRPSGSACFGRVSRKLLSSCEMRSTSSRWNSASHARRPSSPPPAPSYAVP